MRINFLVNRLVILLCFFGLSGCAQFSNTLHTSESSAAIIKSQNDNREYQYLTLENGLRVLLISDSNADVAAVSLDVFVGSGSDPDDRAGLAHFLEHMLFLGTKKYPDAGEYQVFIKENAGEHNAYTSFEHTNYFFNIKPDKLAPALDRFAQFFISPLFDERYAEREKNAVDSEYRARYKDEGRRKQDVLKQIVNQEHPFHKFSIGSLETLSSTNVPIRNDLINFYNTWYSAKNMTLVILGADSLNNMEKMVKDYFAEIPSFDVPDNKIIQPLFNENDLPLWVNIKPEKQVRELTLFFPLPDQKPYFRSKPLMLVSHLLGHEGEGSLLSYLKSMNWADTVRTGSLLDYNGGTDFTLVIGLTEQGLQNQQAVVAAAFNAIERLRVEGVPRWVFDEVALVNNLEFQFKESNNPLYYVMGLTNAMHYFEPKYLLLADYVLDDYQPQLVRSILDKLVLSNCLITVVGGEFEADKIAPHFNVPFKVSEMTASLKKKLVHPDLLKDIRLPQKNTLLPESISLHKIATESSVPEKIVDSDGVQLWYKPINTFLIPKSTANYNFQKIGVHDSAHSSVLLDLYVALLNDSLNELVYPAQMAGLDFALYAHARGVSLKLDGFNDKQGELLETIIQDIAQAKFSDDQFNRIKAELYKNWGNAEKQPPYQKLVSSWMDNMQPHRWGNVVKQQAIENITLEDVNRFADSFWREMSIVAMNNGNVSRAESIAMLGLLKRFIPDIKNVQPAIKIIRLNSEAVAETVSAEHADAGYVLYWQGENNQFETQSRWMVLGAALEADFFNQLRTEQQLGYIVFETYYPILSIPGLVFGVQSPVASVDKIHNAVFSFLDYARPMLQAMTEEQLMVYKMALIHELREQPKSLTEESNEYWYDLALGVDSFDRKERLAASIAALTINEWREFVAVISNQSYSRMYLLTTEHNQQLQNFRPIKNLQQESQLKEYIYQ